MGKITIKTSKANIGLFNKYKVYLDGVEITRMKVKSTYEFTITKPSKLKAEVGRGFVACEDIELDPNLDYNFYLSYKQTGFASGVTTLEKVENFKK